MDVEIENVIPDGDKKTNLVKAPNELFAPPTCDVCGGYARWLTITVDAGGTQTVTNRCTEHREPEDPNVKDAPV